MGMTWIPTKQSSEKNKFLIHSWGGQIEEKEFIERDSYAMDMSARGSICVST